MTRIDCLYFSSTIDLPSQYGVLPFFTKKLHEALLSIGISSKLWHVNKDHPGKFFQELAEDPPLCTISLNYCIENDSGIPHLNILVDSPYYFFNQMSCSDMIWSCADRLDTKIYGGMGFPNIFFLPHATEKLEHPSKKKKYDVVMLSSAIDYEENHQRWKIKYSAGLCEVMNGAVNLILKNPKIACYQAFIDALDAYQEKNGVIDDIPLIEVFHEIDLYVRGFDRVELIRAIKNARIDIFGSKKNGASWEKYIDQPNVFFHDEIPFEKALEVIRESKVVLNSCPTIKDGAHERVFTALAGGALVVSSESIYLREQFPEGSIVYYDSANVLSVSDKIDAYLKKPQERTAAIEEARKLVLQNHTWEQRAKELVVELVPILEKMKINHGR